MVAAAHPVAAAAGAEILAAGGNAVDAAIATSATLGVVEPFGSGIGGGGFLLSYRADTGQVTALDCREAAPAATTPDLLIDPSTGQPYTRNTLLTGGLSVGVPGQVRCWTEALRRFGRLSLMQDLQPAIRAARDGFDVTPYFNHEIGLNRTRLAQFPESASRFLPRGRALAIGAHFAQPELADTLDLIARRGADGFYTDLAPEIVAAVTAPPAVATPAFQLVAGRMTVDDLAGYQVQDRAPLRSTYRGYNLVTAPAPSSGATLLETLNILEGFDLAGLGPDSATSIHVLNEVQRVADADRTRLLGDPGFGAIPCLGLVATAYADTRRSEILADRTSTRTTSAGDPTPFAQGQSNCPLADASSPSPGAPMPAPAEPATGTSHLVVVDGDGNAVTYTATLAIHFGSAISVPGRGFLLNDTLSDFRAEASSDKSNNVPAGSKRPRSTIAPVFLFDGNGNLRFALGAAGADWITPTVAQLVVDLVDWRQTPQAAIDRGRVLPTDERGGVTLEPALYDARPDLVDALHALGHVVTRATETESGAQAIAIDPATGALAGGADNRRDGAIATP
jgi:gamma-glutamyltranspeptidase/glutathione hydrolase